MRPKDAALLSLGGIYVLSSILPLLKGTAWWQRIWDFPRLQFFLGGLAVALSARAMAPTLRRPFAAAMTAALGLDAYRVLPYSPFHPVEVQRAGNSDTDLGEGRSLRLFIANVYQHNRRYAALLETIESAAPDVVLAVEVDSAWCEALSPLSERMPHRVACPLDNEYGIALYSRFPLIEARVEFLVERDIPSIFARVLLPCGRSVALHGVHPRPPRPSNPDILERDAELVLVGRRAAREKGPVVVFGDLNDVAWSHTSRLFRRVSRLLDPRVGRGPYPTFPQPLPFLRFPLDYVFHSNHFRLGSLVRPDGFGSDHFAMLVELVLEAEAREEQDAPRPDASDRREVAELLRRAERS